MNNLNIDCSQQEYFQVMKHRIRYYAEKYDPHTVFYEKELLENEAEASTGKPKQRIHSVIQSFFLAIF